MWVVTLYRVRVCAVAGDHGHAQLGAGAGRRQHRGEGQMLHHLWLCSSRDKARVHTETQHMLPVPPPFQLEGPPWPAQDTTRLPLPSPLTKLINPLLFAQVAGLDGRAIKVPLGHGPVQPGCRITLPGEGMPISKTPSSKGDLHVSIQVTLPRLDEEQRAKVRQAINVG